MSIRRLCMAAAAAGALGLVAPGAQAVTYGFNLSTVTSTSTTNASTYEFGYSFTPTASLTLGSLGAFDINNGALGTAVTVTVWNSAGGVVASVVVPSTATDTGAKTFAYANITPVTLTAGQTYTIGEQSDPNYTAINVTGAPAVATGSFSTYLSNVTAEYSTTGGTKPATANGAGGGYLGPNFSIIGVPEPQTWSLMLAGVALVGGALRSRRVRDLPRRWLAARA